MAREWECLYGPYHIPDFEDVGICLGCGLIHIFCENCGEEIDMRNLDDCPKETRLAVYRLSMELARGGSLPI